MTCLDLSRSLRLLIPVWFLAASVTALAQEPGSAYTPLPSNPGYQAPLGEPLATGPAIPGVPAAPPVWTQQRTTMNQAGTVLNTHRQMNSEDGYLYQRSHVFNAPDGTPLRQHEWNRTGTDPNNYTRQHEMQLRDGRTILHGQTRSWDGVSGTMERTFQGPNGQTRQVERPWTPDGDLPLQPDATIVGPAPGELSTLPPSPTVEGAGPGAGPEAMPARKKAWGWLDKLNPFRKNRSPRAAESGRRPSLPGSGFTMGAGGRGRMGQVPPGLTRNQPGQPSPNSHRPAWAGHSSSQSARPPGAARGRNR
ncbi:MAG: hypothetical protein HQ582_08860 [Planctomycetes bacterium]|nr:hypothetical protein [Planctomycetota bacterium]